MKKTKKERDIINEKTYSKYFVIIAAISIASLLISNITSVKVISIGGIILPSSALLFPITYIVGDIIAEIYGYKKARFIILLGFTCNLFMVLYFTLAIHLPSSPTWANQEAFALTLGTTPRMFVASLVAVLSGGLSNAYVMNFLKKVTNGKKLWIRTIGSTIVGEALDTIAFVNIAFLGTVPYSVIITMMLSQFIWKVAYEALATPLTYAAIKKYRKLEESL